jgi:multidrug efflux system outer membrane protein
VQQNLGGEGAADDVQHGGLYGFQLSWELDLFGRIRREHEAAFARMLASEQGRRGVLVTLVGDVASTYFLLRQLDLELDIARRTLSNNDQTVTLFENRLNGGLSNRLEVDRIRANRAVTAASIPDLEQLIARTENAVSLLLGRAPGPIMRTPLGSELPPPLIPPGLPASLLERRPDVVAAEELLHAANADVGAARALFFPTIRLTGLLGAISGDLTSLLGGSGAVWSAGPSVLQPLFRGGRLRSNLEAAQATFDEAMAQYRRAALNAYREVANAIVTIDTLANVRVEREAGVAALQDAARPLSYAIRRGSGQLSRDSDRRSGSLPRAGAAGTDARRRTAGARRTVPRARRRMATVGALLQCKMQNAKFEIRTLNPFEF